MGALLTLDRCLEHDAEALEESAFLLTDRLPEPTNTNCPMNPRDQGKRNLDELLQQSPGPGFALVREMENHFKMRDVFALKGHGFIRADRSQPKGKGFRPLRNGLRWRNGIEWVGVRQEKSAAFAAGVGIRS